MKKRCSFCGHEEDVKAIKCSICLRTDFKKYIEEEYDECPQCLRNSLHRNAVGEKCYICGYEDAEG